MVVAVMLAIILGSSDGKAADDLEREFTAPPDSVRPWTYWYWYTFPTKGNITRDLVAMKEQGIKGGLLFPFKHYSGPAWLELFRHCVAEAKRLGLEIVMNHDAGWSCEIPWLTPKYVQKLLVSGVTPVEGGKTIRQVLPLPVKSEKSTGIAT